MEESTDFLHEPEEWIAGTIKGFEDMADNGFGPSLKWVIELDGQGSDDFDKWAFTPAKLTAKNKLGKWLTAMGVEVEKGKSIERNDLIGRRVEVMFERFEKDGMDREKIVRVRAEKGAKTDLQNKQTQATAAKAPKRETTDFANPDEAPF